MIIKIACHFGVVLMGSTNITTKLASLANLTVLVWGRTTWTESFIPIFTIASRGVPSTAASLSSVVVWGLL